MAVGSILGIQRANLAPLINELTSRGLVERRAAPNDKRALALCLTSEGQGLLREARARALEHEDRILSGFTTGQRRQLLNLLGKIGPGPAATSLSASHPIQPSLPICRETPVKSAGPRLLRPETGSH
jgi:hypothetical protein